MEWWPHQWHPQMLLPMGFLTLILVPVPLTKARSTFPEKLDQVLVPQVPDSGIKCMECPCVNPCPCMNPCAQHPPPPPPPSTQYCCPLAPPYTKSDLDLYDTGSSNVGRTVVIVILVLVGLGLGVLLWWCVGPCKLLLIEIVTLVWWGPDKICTRC